MKNENEKHTPGPWKTNINPKGHYNIRDTSDNTPCIAQTLSGVNDEANARLIAAAPDMKIALMRISARLNAIGGPTKEELMEASEIARAAIAKAKGE